MTCLSGCVQLNPLTEMELLMFSVNVALLVTGIGWCFAFRNDRVAGAGLSTMYAGQLSAFLYDMTFFLVGTSISLYCPNDE